MRLKVKILIIICGIFLVMVALLHGITTSIILGSFAQLEEKNIHTDLRRVLNALENDLEGMNATGGDWGAWDETRDFVKNRDREYTRNNLTFATFTNLKVNFMLYFNNAGVMTHSICYLLGDDGKEVPVSKDLVNQIREHKLFLTHKDAEDSKTGILLLPDDMAIITAWPISNNDMEGEVSGTTIIGRYFNENEIASLEERTQLKLEIKRRDDAFLPDDFNKANKGLSGGDEISINSDLPDLISGYAFVSDIFGKDSMILKVSSSRDVYKQGQKTTNYFRWVQLIVGVVVLAVLFLVLRFTVLKPILRLKEHVLSVGKSGDLSTRLGFKRRDEIGALAGEFDRMLEQLSDTRNRLMEQSYYSGIGEMASGILHNLRNILTPMVGQIGKIRDNLREVPMDNIEQAIAELNSGRLEEGRKKLLLKYLSLALPRLSGINQDIDKGLMVVSGQATHMEEVLADQDKFSHFKKTLEPLNFDMIIEDAIKLMPHKLINAIEIHREDSLANLPPVYAERVVLIQVVTNILNNASESILRKGDQKGRVWISGKAETEGDLQKIHVVVRDDGEGIDKEDQKKIFTRGYSTKTPKSSGIGLHWCSNVLSAMDADLYVESDGAGYGSSFHIKMPAAHNQSIPMP